MAVTEKTLPAELAPARQKFLELIADIRPELHRYCARITGSVISGEDIVQDVIAKVFYEISMANELPPLRPLMFRVAHNAAIDFLRRYEQKHVELVAEIPEDQMVDDADPMVLRAALSSFMALPIRQRSAVILKDVLGLTAQEIADATDTTVPGVKAALVRGRAALRAEAGEAGSAEPTRLPVAELAQLRRYVSLFNARDWDGVRGLLSDECRLDLVSQAARQGKAVGQYFARYEAETGLRLVAGTLEGRAAIAVHRAPDPAPAYFMLLQWEGDRVTSIRDFRYVPYIAASARFIAG
jgi:RNA polymerase sigma-70 factor (ECF subfamily)